MLSSQEHEIARTVLKNLRGERYKDWNYLFLTPFDLNQVPGYLDVVEKPLDLQTITQNLEGGVYNTLAHVWADIKCTFENAIKYHRERETKWIAKMAKDMIKYFNKERKAVEKSRGGAASASAPVAGGGKPTIKLKLGKQLPTAGNKAAAITGGKKSLASVPSEVAPVAVSSAADTEETASMAPPKPKKQKIKVKLPTKKSVEVPDQTTSKSVSLSAKPAPAAAQSSGTAAADAKPKPPKPVIRLKLKGPTSASTNNSKQPPSSTPSPVPPSSNAAVSVEIPAAPAEDGSAAQSSAASSKSSSAKSSKSSSGAKVSVKLGNSRGKELPKGVVQSSASTSKSTAAASSKSATSTSSSKSANAPSSKSANAHSSKSTNAPSSKSTNAPSSKSANAPSSKAPSTKAAPSSKTAPSTKAAPSAKTAPSTKTAPSAKTATAASSKAAPSTKAAKMTSSTKAAKTASPAVAAPAAPTPTATTSSSKDSSTAKAGQKRKRSKKSSAKESTTSGGGGLPPEQLQACAKVLLGLKRRQQSSISWFLNPVSDKTIIQDYRAKIKHPMDINKMSAKIENKFYKSLADFCLDMRRIFSNCLCYNTSMKDTIRQVAAELLGTAEDLMAFFFAEVGNPAYPKLLFCWKLCLEVLGTLYNIVNPVDLQPTVLYFLHPVKIYCGGQFPKDYLEKVPKPIDFQTVTSNLLEGCYQSISEFAADCKLIVQNCNTYYSGREDGRLYIEQANRLGAVMDQQLEQLARYEKSSKGIAEKQKANTPNFSVLRPPVHVLSSVLDDLRDLKYTDKATKITEPAMGPFEKPVSLTIFPDYLQRISEPMDLQSVERKAKSSAYATPEDFEYDMNLLFRNCEKYHSERNGEHLVAMAKFGARNFRRIFYAKMKAMEDPSPAPPARPDPATSQEALETSVSLVSSGGPPSKKQKVEGVGVSKGKVAPRISINLSSAAPPAPPPAARSNKSPKVTGQTQKKNTASPKVVTNQPVPLHIAIARVKEAFPLRRAVKSLQLWEADCARYFKELLRHPWLSAARPKFIFHVPVTMLFPELRDAYAAKIRKPMDLTTVECTLLAGNRYTSCEDLIDDVALTFSNAIRFNKDGRDIGDPLSCAYYDASVHLLRYARWLSLELLPVDKESDHFDEGGPEGLPPLSWKLTSINQEIAQKEQMDIVLKEPIEKSLEGDRYTWHESECEKLLKALRHQSDVKLMTYFIRADYPPDYAAYISKPMDWEKVQRNLKKRHYDNFGQIIEDLRLIFKNALKYNFRCRGKTDTVSGHAYAAAEIMSGKLENAIRKLMLSVSDRIERERIDHSNAEREMDADKKAEEARIRAAWKKDPNNTDGSSPPPFSKDHGSDRARGGGITKSRLARRQQEATDFEVPFFDDENDAQHERSFIDLIKMQKSMFEKQRQELVRMRQTALGIGTAVYSRYLQRTLAQKWVTQELKRATSPADPVVVAPNPAVVVSATNDSGGVEMEQTQKNQLSSSVLQELERSDRGHIKISFKPKEKKKSGKKRPLPFDF